MIFTSLIKKGTGSVTLLIWERSSDFIQAM